MKNITLIAGTRPNFMKIAPLIHAIKKAQSEGVDIAYRLVHTGRLICSVNIFVVFIYIQFFINSLRRKDCLFIC